MFEIGDKVYTIDSGEVVEVIIDRVANIPDDDILVYVIGERIYGSYDIFLSYAEAYTAKGMNNQCN
ncbi:hypothetical protein [Alicyclobacillus acidoterrestris]|uniref:Uncharacterized protein n=1 Tax=Alicyclobacillus acidoterrestris (strain ATCC 49025 / DSM 3922 / CIP 106132 / NCIMB 13137 / GD3B) TaxID=1356854 RepID=T0C553_ALIAG|nr:hypothetical protein [Alicyclobacillus acidoterrestris]EPZ47675.1 hypothetical protein N007_05315 [Alicyclobacillus acidoterrestris ATCC 49025]UNO48007.1 hypothetical protein K1I37_15135 [Alicyclobacillus acidoterrestris]